ncbi:MAG: amino acid adenylation domain-containing protein [Cyanothece sp. SIO2G6]|nr:amino acid adenylation domain-containing protein [Cyanothece sp. SIO2G6]
MDKKNIADIYPLSPMQKGMLFHELLTPETGVYVPQVCLTFAGQLDGDRLQQAWQQVLLQHPALRSSFHWEKRDDPFQVVYHRLSLPWQYEDWRSLSSDVQQKKFNAFLEGDRQQGFDLKSPPLMRITLIHLAEEQYQLIWTQHHLIVDGWAAAIVIKDVFDVYHQLPLRSRPPYRDYIAWLRQQDQQEAQQFWQQQLRGFSTPTRLSDVLEGIGHASPQGAQPNSLQSHSAQHWQEQAYEVGQAVTQSLKSLAQAHQLTLNTLIQGSLAIAISRYCDADDVVFGSTRSGRPTDLPGSATMVGLFINTLPVRVQLSDEKSLIARLQQLQQQQAEALPYEYASLMDVQDWSELPQSTALFDTILVVENYPIEPSSGSGEQGLQLKAVRSLEWTHFPLTILVAPSTTLKITVKYDGDRIVSEAIDQFIRHWQTTLDHILTHPDCRIGELSVLTDSEQQQLLVDWNQTQQDYPQDRCLHQWVEQQVGKTPDAIAITFQEQRLTYSELNHQANQLAYYLQSVGVQPEQRVGIRMKRCVEMVVAILGILKAGATYVPLDPDYPHDRLEYIQAHANVSIILTAEDVQSNKILAFPATNPNSIVTPDNAIYVLYTSGSTGQPKGVVNTHRALVNRLHWMQSEYGLDGSDRVLQKTPFSFDVSVWEFFWPLITGARLVIAEPGGHRDSTYLGRIIEQEQITTLHFVPSMLQVFLDEADDSKLNVGKNSVKRIICSGEALPRALGDRVHTHFNATLHNLYGPTEAAIDVTAHTHSSSAFCLHPSAFTSVPIGKPIHNTQLYILDSHLRPTPIGVPGELYIGGGGLARGYLNNPALTAERFIPNPFYGKAEGRRQKAEIKAEGTRQKAEIKAEGTRQKAEIKAEGTRQKAEIKAEGTRQKAKEEIFQNPKSKIPNSLTLYKTGDRVRYLPDGTIEFLERVDTQVKLRGLRVELGEIETAIMAHSTIHQAIVTVTQRHDQQYLIAYVVMKSISPDTALLKEFLGDRLPPYMIPTAFIPIETIPLTVNGKLDRRSLPMWQPTGSAEMIVPRTATEQVIKEIWSSVLKVDRFSVEDNFFDLGGNSLLATRINSRLREVFDLEVPLRSLFEKQTVAALSQYVDATQMALKRTPQDLFQKPQGESNPVSPLGKGGLRGVNPQSQPNSSTSKGRKEIEL